MNSIDRTNPLANMLSNAFDKFDQDRDGKLNTAEFSSFYEILKPGIGYDANNSMSISCEQYQDRMDHDGDQGVSKDEMLTTTVLMPAELTDESLDAMVQYLLASKDPKSVAAAAILASEVPDKPTAAGTVARA